MANRYDVFAFVPPSARRLAATAYYSSLRVAVSQRACIVLACAAGEANSTVARRFELCMRTTRNANGTEGAQGAHELLQLYNERRSHQSLDYRTPDEVYFGALLTAAAA